MVTSTASDYQEPAAKPVVKLPKQKYVLKEGVGVHTHHAGPGEMTTIKAGETVELTKGQALAFKDKFEPFSAVVARAEIAKRQAELDEEAEVEAEAERKAEQKRLREEGQKGLAKERAKLKDDDADETESEDESDDDSSPTKDAETKAPSKNPNPTVKPTVKKA